MPSGGCDLHTRDVFHDGRQKRRDHGGIPGGAGPHEQGGHRVCTRHSGGQSISADGRFVQGIQTGHRGIQRKGGVLPVRRMPGAAIHQPDVHRRCVRIHGSGGSVSCARGAGRRRLCGFYNQLCLLCGVFRDHLHGAGQDYVCRVRHDAGQYGAWAHRSGDARADADHAPASTKAQRRQSSIQGCKFYL